MNLIESAVSNLAPHICIVCGAEPWLLCPGCSGHVTHGQAPQLPSVDSIDHIWASTTYDNEVKVLIGLLKFNRAKHAATILAGLLDASLPCLPSETLIVPTPTANKRIRLRGYDQAQLIAHALAKTRKYKRCSVLHRRTATRQVGSTKVQRVAQMKRAFIVSQPSKVRGRHILLVDDVMTTGATLSSAAHLLRDHGAKSVSAAVCAYKP